MQDNRTGKASPEIGKAEHRGSLGLKACACFIFLLLVLVLLCHKFHTHLVQYIESLGSLIEWKWMEIPMIAYVITCVGVFGVVVSIHAWWQELAHAKQVERFLKRVVAEQWNKEKLMQEWTEQGKLGLMFSKRMGMLLGDNYERLRHVVPSLAVMREISLRTELGRWRAAFVAVVVSILLILGIFATLMGVHSVLKQPVGSDIAFTDLSKALLPSAIAVIFTVGLTIFRAVHLRKVELLVARVDAACISILIPIFCEKKESAVDTSSLGSCSTISEEDVKSLLAGMTDFEVFQPVLTLNVGVDEVVKEQIDRLKRFSLDIPSILHDEVHDFTKERELINKQAEDGITKRIAQCAIAPITNIPS